MLINIYLLFLNKISFSNSLKISYPRSLKKFIKSQLKSLKISNIDIINKDTFKNRTEFFSARRALKNKENDYGRNISIIMLK